MHLHQGKEGIMVVAGCRYFTIDEAKEHWRPENIGSWTQKEVSYGERQIRMINFLEAEAIAKGWFADEIHEIKEKSVSEK